MTGRFWIASGALLAGAAVVAGAMGTHYLKETLHVGESELQTYDVAVRYQMHHAMALLLVGLLAGRTQCRCLRISGGLFLLGIGLFSGGLYAWLATGIKPLVHVVPVGGLAWIVAWLLLAWTAIRPQTDAP
jgi:uncharacterized membrane protein YgdD (TMEM256/DUF423 family)